MSLIPINIHPSFWLMALIIGWLAGQSLYALIAWVATILLSLLLHEHGHAVTARLFGQKSRIELNFFGGMTTREGPPLHPWQNFLIVLAGPSMGFLTALTCYALLLSRLPLPALFQYALFIGLYINIFWTLLNLLPIYPLDGGQLLTIALQKFFGIRGLKASFLIGCITGLLLSFFFFAEGFIIGGAITLLLGWECWKSLRQTYEMSDEDSDPLVQKQFEEFVALFERGELIEAQKKGEMLLSATKQGQIRGTTARYLAQIAVKRADYDTGFALLHPLYQGLPAEEQMMYVQSSFKLKKWQEALRAGEKLFQVKPSAELALLNARCCGMLELPEAAVGWLKSAKRAGVADLRAVAMESYFDGLRHTPAFEKILETNGD